MMDIKLTVSTSNFLRGVLSIIIVLHHLQFVVDIPVLSVFKPLGAPAVSIFFFISGYGLMSSVLKNPIVYFQGFWKKRLFKILIPFLLASILFHLLNEKTISLSAAISALVFKGETQLPYSWFVYSIILFYIFFYISFKVFDVDHGVKVALVFVLVLLYMVLTKEILNFERAWWVSAIAFPVGILVKLKEVSISEILNTKRRVLLTIGGLICLILFFYSFQKEWLYVPVYMLFPLVSISVLNLVTLSYSKLSLFLGGISYEIYLIHGIWIYCFRTNTVFLSPDWMYVFVVLIATIFTAYLLSKVSIFLFSQV